MDLQEFQVNPHVTASDCLVLKVQWDQWDHLASQEKMVSREFLDRLESLVYPDRKVIRDPWETRGHTGRMVMMACQVWTVSTVLVP